jgi:hypothetical protein
MGWKEFIVEIVAALAWPAAIAFIAYLFRRQLGNLIKSVRTVKYMGAEAEFGDSVEEGEALAEQVPLPPATPEAEELEDIERLPPRAAVLEAWLEVEAELQDLADRVGLSMSPSYGTSGSGGTAGPEGMSSPSGRAYRSGWAIARKLAKEGVISPTLLRLVEELNRGRHAAVHVRRYEVDPQEVANYVALARRTTAYLTERAEEAGPAYANSAYSATQE